MAALVRRLQSRRTAARLGPPPPYELPPDPPPLPRTEAEGVEDPEGEEEEEEEDEDDDGEEQDEEEGEGGEDEGRERNVAAARQPAVPARGAATPPLSSPAAAAPPPLQRTPPRSPLGRRSAKPAPVPAPAPASAPASASWAGLPVELLENIFLFAASDLGALVRCEGVCVRWRKIVRACARLWHRPRLAAVPARALPDLFARHGRHFQVVALRGREFPTEALKAMFARRLPSVIEVDLRFTVKISSPVLRAVVKACRNLQVLLLSLSIMPAGLRPEGLATIYTCHRLRCLNLSECQLSMDKRLSRYAHPHAAPTARDQAQGSAPIMLGRSSRRIGGFARQLTDAALAAILDGCPELEELYLSGCKALTVATARKLAAQTKLRILDLSFCDGLTAGGFRTLAAGRSRLEVVFAAYCPLSVDDVRVMQLAQPQLQILGLHAVTMPDRTAPQPQRRP